MTPKQPSNKPQPVAVSKTQTFSGPLPPPAVLRDYEEFIPGSAERIIAMAEKQGDHRRALESAELELGKAIVEKSFSEARWGQVCATIVSLSFLAAGTFLGLNGHELAASVIGGFGMAGIVTAFLTSRRERNPEGESAVKTTATSTPAKKGRQKRS